MKPHKFGQHWIDLDTLQTVSEPTFINQMGSGGYFITVVMQFAFQNEPRVFRWCQEALWDHSSSGHKLLGPEKNAQGICTMLQEVWDDLYRPLMLAWANTDPGLPRPLV